METSRRPALARIPWLAHALGWVGWFGVILGYQVLTYGYTRVDTFWHPWESWDPFWRAVSMLPVAVLAVAGAHVALTYDAAGLWWARLMAVVAPIPTALLASMPFALRLFSDRSPVTWGQLSTGLALLLPTVALDLVLTLAVVALHHVRHQARARARARL